MVTVPHLVFPGDYCISFLGAGQRAARAAGAVDFGEPVPSTAPAAAGHGPAHRHQSADLLLAAPAATAGCQCKWNGRRIHIVG